MLLNTLQLKHYITAEKHWCVPQGHALDKHWPIQASSRARQIEFLSTFPQTGNHHKSAPTNQSACPTFLQTLSFNNSKFFSKINYKFLNKNIVHLLHNMKPLQNGCIMLKLVASDFKFLITPVLLIFTLRRIKSSYVANVQ